MQCFCPVSQLLPSWSCLPPHCTVVLRVFGRAGWTGAALETETRSQIFWKCAALGVLLLISETQLLYGKKTHASARARARAHTLLPSFNMHTDYKLWIQRVFFFFFGFIETGFCSDTSKLKTHRVSDFLPCRAAGLPSLPRLTQQAACFGWVAGLSSSFKVLDSYCNQGFLLYISRRNKSDKSYWSGEIFVSTFFGGKERWKKPGFTLKLPKYHSNDNHCFCCKALERGRGKRNADGIPTNSFKFDESAWIKESVMSFFFFFISLWLTLLSKQTSIILSWKWPQLICSPRGWRTKQRGQNNKKKNC